MPKKKKVTITLSEKNIDFIDDESEVENTNRSAFIDKLIDDYFTETHKVDGTRRGRIVIAY